MIVKDYKGRAMKMNKLTISVLVINILGIISSILYYTFLYEAFLGAVGFFLLGISALFIISFFVLFLAKEFKKKLFISMLNFLPLISLYLIGLGVSYISDEIFDLFVLFWILGIYAILTLLNFSLNILVSKIIGKVIKK